MQVYDHWFQLEHFKMLYGTVKCCILHSTKYLMELGNKWTMCVTKQMVRTIKYARILLGCDCYSCIRLSTYIMYVHLSLCTLSFYIISFHITVIYRTTRVDETRLLSTSANVDSRIDVTELWNNIYRRTNSQLSLELFYFLYRFPGVVESRLTETLTMWENN